MDVESVKAPQALKQWLGEGSFSQQEQMDFRDCDAQGRVRPGTLLSMAAVVAGHDFDAQGLTYSYLYRLRQVFLLSRITLHIHRQPLLGEILTVTTWENGAKAAHVQRNYEMADESGTVLVSGKSDWIIVDPVERRILRPSCFTEKKVRFCPKVIDCPECRRIVPLREGLEELGERRIVYSDLDRNGHLFSGNYGNVVWDYLPTDLQNATVKTFSLNYNKEVTLGDTLRLLGRRDGDAFFMEGLCGEEHCFTCRCLF